MPDHDRPASGPALFRESSSEPEDEPAAAAASSSRAWMSTSATPEEGEAAGPDAMDVDAQASAPASPVDASLPAPSSPQARRSAKPSASRLPAGSDPNLLASLPVYLSASLPQSSRLSLFQYPTYPRGSPLPVPDSARSRGLREAARWRPKADRVEVELPLDVRQTVYNLEKGQEMARGAEHGGTFGEKKVKKEPGSSRRDREREKEKDKAPKRLEKTRLESQLVPNQTRYFVGVIRDGALHLTPLDSVQQMRPSLHYLDGIDTLELAEKRRSKASSDSGSGSEDEGGAAAAAAAAAATKKKGTLNVVVGMGPKDQKDGLMQSQRDAEAEKWIELEWRNSLSDEASKTFESQLFASTKVPLTCTTKMREFLPAI